MPQNPVGRDDLVELLDIGRFLVIGAIARFKGLFVAVRSDLRNSVIVDERHFVAHTVSVRSSIRCALRASHHIKLLFPDIAPSAPAVLLAARLAGPWPAAIADDGSLTATKCAGQAPRSRPRLPGIPSGQSPERLSPRQNGS